MYLKEFQIDGFKSFGKSTTLSFPTRITAIVGPNGSGKSNVVEAFRFVLGEQSMKAMRGKRGEDLIFNGGSKAKRANRARVTVVFDNADHHLNKSFDEVSISRTVYRNGVNEYSINGTQVRRCDIVELLAQVNIGPTGHHIISQGAADRILHATNEERKEMIEDGLGLKLLQHRRMEAEKKLQRAQANIAETDLVLHEIAPRLRYLKKQVDRHNKAQKLLEEVTEQYAEYLARETKYVALTRCALERDLAMFDKTFSTLEKQCEEERKRSAVTNTLNRLTEKEKKNYDDLRAIRDQKDVLSRHIGRMEGECAALETFTNPATPKPISRRSVSRLYTTVCEEYAQKKREDCAAIVVHVIACLKDILNTQPKKQTHDADRLALLQKKRERSREQSALLKKQEEELVCIQESLRQKKDHLVTSVRQSEKKLLSLLSKKNLAEKNLADAQYALTTLCEDEKSLKEEITEGSALIGTAVDRYKEVIVPREFEHEDRSKQKDRRKNLERKKIALESIGVAGDDSLYSEYKEVADRFDFLKREKKDLLTSIHDCETGISAVQKEVEVRFANGIRAISKEFDQFFKVLFGGGSATLSVEHVRPSEESDESNNAETRVGVSVHVSLPRKKIHTLEQLSGGERALVSVALLFALSQVTPPPFLVLDETDAALDEANSHRYGNIVEILGKRSQLILITHNRETMHRAGALYGVTMNSAGTSSLLSVQFDAVSQTA